MDQTRSSLEVTTDRVHPDSTRPHLAAADQAPEAADPRQIDRYVIQSHIGQGGFGRVFRAFDPQLQRQIAIKVPRIVSAWKAAETDTFLREARLAVRLAHPNVVAIHDVGTADECGFYIAMEYVDGESLQRRLQRGPLSFAETADIIGGIAAAMQYAHKRGVIHRDLKPANVLIDKAGHVKVTDFGLAVSEEFQSQHAGEVSGTPAYMSPEQVRGEVDKLDGRSDIWSLGVILYECLTGRRPFLGTDWPAIREGILTRAPKPPRQIDDTIPPAVEAICLACLEKDQSKRPSTATDVASQIAMILKPEANSRSKYQNPAGVFAIGTGIFALLAGTVLAIARSWEIASTGEEEHPHNKNASIEVASLAPGILGERPSVARRSASDWTQMKDFSFNYRTTGNTHFFDPVRKHYRVICDAYAAFDAADQPGSTFRLTATGKIGERSHFGVLWNIQKIPTQPLNDRAKREINDNSVFKPELNVAYSSSAAYFVAAGVDKTPCVRIGQLIFAGISSDLTGIHENGFVEEIPVEWDRQIDCQIEVTVRDGKLTHVIFQGAEIAIKKSEKVVAFNSLTDSQVGVLAAYDTIDVVDFGLIDEERLK